MADNGTQLFVACNGPSFIYNATTGAFSQITDGDFPGAVTVDYLDGFFVFNEPNSQKIWVTSLLNGLSVDPLDFASAEGSPDGVVGVVADHRELWVFGTNSVEVWYNSGGADFPLSRIQGAFNELGCAPPTRSPRWTTGYSGLGKTLGDKESSTEPTGIQAPVFRLMRWNGRFNDMVTCQMQSGTPTNRTVTPSMS
jgi:hypothetical protein